MRVIRNTDAGFRDFTSTAMLFGVSVYKDEVVCSTFGGGVAVVHQPQGVGYLEADIDAFDVFHGAVFGQFGGTAFKGGVEDAEAVQTEEEDNEPSAPFRG